MGRTQHWILGITILIGCVLRKEMPEKLSYCNSWYSVLEASIKNLVWLNSISKTSGNNYFEWPFQGIHWRMWDRRFKMWNPKRFNQIQERWVISKVKYSLWWKLRLSWEEVVLKCHAEETEPQNHFSYISKRWEETTPCLSHWNALPPPEHHGDADLKSCFMSLWSHLGKEPHSQAFRVYWAIYTGSLVREGERCHGVVFDTTHLVRGELIWKGGR